MPAIWSQSDGTISYTCTGIRGRVTIALTRESNSEGERSMLQGDKHLSLNPKLNLVDSTI